MYIDTLKSFLRGLLVFSALFQIHDVASQGCSDAGACSISGIRHDIEEDDTLYDKTSSENAFTISNAIGIGQTRYRVWIGAWIVEGQWIRKNFLLSVQLSSAIKYGPLGLVTGLSDVIVAANINFYKNLKLIAGGKIPFNDANIKKDGYALPMAYQTTLGTYDFITGLAFEYRRWLFSTAWQQPLIQNGNQFESGVYLNELTGLYVTTKNFIRMPDLILRISHSLKYKNPRWKQSLGLLTIYHMDNDKYVDKNSGEILIYGSKGLTLNINSTWHYQPHETSKWEFLLGFPVKARKIRPEGLSQFTLQAKWIKFF